LNIGFGLLSTKKVWLSVGCESLVGAGAGAQLDRANATGAKAMAATVTSSRHAKPVETVGLLLVLPSLGLAGFLSGTEIRRCVLSNFESMRLLAGKCRD
jgi:hypothetical protein